MIGVVFTTVAEELAGCVEAIISDFRNRGYSVRIEPQKIEYPSVPTLSASRQQTTFFFNVGRNAKSKSIDAWIQYCKSCNRDTRLVFATDRTPSAQEIQHLHQHRVGLVVFADGRLAELQPAHDLAVKIGLQDLAEFDAKLRRWIAPIYEKFDRGEWRDGFDDACSLLEEKARDYFIEYSKSGRIQVLRKTGPLKLEKKKIEKLSLGQLKDEFQKIVSPTGDDKKIGDSLQRINPDRILSVHKKGRASTEKRLRSNVGHHMWVIIGVLQIISKHL